MAVIIPLQAPARHPAWNPARPGREPLPSDLAGWRPEQLWLSSACWSLTAQLAMADAVSTAVDAVLAAETAVLPRHELLFVFRTMRREAAWLRLAARVLRGPLAEATPRGRDLAASALWLAVLRHDDLLASVEFAAEVTGRAILLDDSPVASGPVLPPGFRTPAQLAGRMRRRGRELLARRFTWPDIETIGTCLRRALEEDPLHDPGERSGLGGA